MGTPCGLSAINDLVKTIYSLASKMSEKGDGLDGLSEAHLIREDTIEVFLVECH